MNKQAAGVAECVAGLAVFLWAKGHSPNMGFMEMCAKADSYILKEPFYDIILIIAALLGLAGIINIVIGIQKSCVPNVVAVAPQDKARQRMLAEAPKLIIGTWRDENSLSTYRADGTMIIEFKIGGTEGGKWSIGGGLLTCVIAERDGKALDNPDTYHYKILDINDSTFDAKEIEDGGAEWRATRVKEIEDGGAEWRATKANECKWLKIMG